MSSGETRILIPSWNPISAYFQGYQTFREERIRQIQGVPINRALHPKPHTSCCFGRSQTYQINEGETSTGYRLLDYSDQDLIKLAKNNPEQLENIIVEHQIGIERLAGVKSGRSKSLLVILAEKSPKTFENLIDNDVFTVDDLARCGVDLGTDLLFDVDNGEVALLGYLVKQDPKIIDRFLLKNQASVKGLINMRDLRGFTPFHHYAVTDPHGLTDLVKTLSFEEARQIAFVL